MENRMSRMLIEAVVKNALKVLKIIRNAVSAIS